MKNIALMADFNTIKWWFVIVVYFLGHPIAASNWKHADAIDARRRIHTVAVDAVVVVIVIVELTRRFANTCNHVFRRCCHGSSMHGHVMVGGALLQPWRHPRTFFRLYNSSYDITISSYSTYNRRWVWFNCTTGQLPTFLSFCKELNK